MTQALRHFSIIMIVLTLTGCATVNLSDRHLQPLPARLTADMGRKGMTPAGAILIRIFKKESELEVWKKDQTGRFALLKTYPMCRWSGKLGPKTREGDRQAPEGFYMVTPAMMNPNSDYYLSFNLGYPNPLERGLGYTGDALMVHGACTSAGCFAMTDEGIAEIYALAREAFTGGQKAIQVQALPFRMNPENLAAHQSDLSLPLWQNLKEGSDHFELTREEPIIQACGGRYVFNAAPKDPSATFDPAAPCPAYDLDTRLADLLAAKQDRDTARVEALISSVGSGGVLAYTDGGMHVSFRDRLRRMGPDRFAKATSSGVKVSRPKAALSDPYVP